MGSNPTDPTPSLVHLPGGTITMGATFADVVTSAPSTWGAANATSAAIVFPLGWPVALLLLSVVSDPAQMWHAGDRYAEVATLVRQAGEQMTDAVTRRAHADHWVEKGRDAFMANRLRPYQTALDQAAGMYDEMDGALKASALSYTGLGMSSAIIGSSLLSFVAPYLAAAVVPGIGASTTYVANKAMVEAGVVVRGMVASMAKVNGTVATMLSGLAVRLGVSQGALTGTAATGTATVAGGIGGYQTIWRAAPTMRESVSPVSWPAHLRDGETPPKGYHGATAVQLGDMKRIDHRSLEALGRDLDASASGTLDRACELARGNEVGVPGFGAAGVHLAYVCAGMRDTAVRHLTAGRDEPGKWLPALRTVADNWAYAEDATVKATRHVR
ncbi:hypothetical protein [Sphaerisporangium rhizosphaerae]|uniref:Uncharacterized protein n=1 Tax=Sphaerisporangium rhizosphaerae TaxID=2269375 RepID=A0ABW2P339_9ACTN